MKSIELHPAPASTPRLLTIIAALQLLTLLLLLAVLVK